MRRFLGSIMVLVSIYLFALSGCTAKEAKTLYVSMSGNDRNPGTLSQPFRTIQQAANCVGPGETILVREGIYYEQVILKTSGKKKQPITFKTYKNEQVVIDGTHLTLEDKDEMNGLFSLVDKSHIIIQGFDIKNLITQSNSVPSGIRVSGSGENIQIIDCRVSNIKVDYKKVSKEKANAHGIAFYGTKKKPLKNIVIKESEVFNNQLGQSEALVLNGNVTDFEISHNKIHHNDNIGIDLIGFEKIAPKNDQVRNGVVKDNQVWQISSRNNPAYEGETSAGGIYVDGGKKILIKSNQVWDSDIGVEIASEHKGKTTSNITLLNNEITQNKGLAGIAIGGYDENRGHAKNITIDNNYLSRNGVDILVQFNAQYSSNKIINNILESEETFSGDFSQIQRKNNK